ncbi:hypothetical protein ACQEV4_40285 [Streptomyces shenzhenensis]|uniref:hypothetical protein n=1 Tax=Streptomyces shenzhenensis TaxID=943815 RepID=UPI003D8CA186
MNVERGSDYRVTADREVTPEQRVAASRVVLRHARSRDDLHYLLDLLGLNTQTSKEA